MLSQLTKPTTPLTTKLARRCYEPSIVLRARIHPFLDLPKNNTVECFLQMFIISLNRYLFVEELCFILVALAILLLFTLSALTLKLSFSA